jgi:predicted O-methyltransferase YrrM
MNSERADGIRSPDPASNEALVEKYGAIEYATQSNAQSHPERLATVGTLHGLSPPPVTTCRVLELGCSDGANLLPMAAALPGATFVGCDLFPGAIESARSAATELGLANVTFWEGDLRKFPEDLGPFDYVIAHGLYSWVPVDVRDALFALAAAKLSPNGLMFVSYNVYPGCHVRQATWEVLHLHTDGLDSPRERLEAARRLANAIAEGGISQDATDALLRREFARVAKQTDSSIYHDDLAVPNDPVYFRRFVEHAGRHGLAFVSEAKLFNSSDLGLSASMRQIVSGLGRVEREQYLDFACLRRFRQSVLCRAEATSALALVPDRAALMHVAASHSLLGAAQRGKSLLNPARPVLGAAEQQRLNTVLARLVDIAPRAIPGVELESLADGAAQSRSAASGSFPRLLVDACFADELLLSICPPQIAEIPSERPLASPVARWEARRGFRLTNLWHEAMTIPDAPARALLALCDGARDRAELDVAAGAALELTDPVQRRSRIEGYVRQFGRLGLLIR